MMENVAFSYVVATAAKCAGFIFSGSVRYTHFGSFAHFSNDTLYSFTGLIARAN